MNQNLKKMEDEELITRRTGPVDENNGILNKVSNLVSDNSTNERLAEIELTRNRMNGINPSSEQEEQHEKDLLKDIPEEMMQQRLGSSGSLGLILGGGPKSLYSLGKYLAKNIGKKKIIKKINKSYF
tara:strand:+ start:634 stop:1014 length:381 start_codon:yes stop_codon:yes gene_type:complete